MFRLVNFLLIFLCAFWGGCTGSPSMNPPDSKTSKKTIAENCAKLDVKTKCIGTGTLASDCFFDEVNNVCAAKNTLRFSTVGFVDDGMKAITKEGYLYEQNEFNASLKNQKIKAITTMDTQDYCVIKDDDSLECPVHDNLAPVPPNVKAKQISMGQQKTVCYTDLNDELHCFGKTQVPNAQYGSIWKPFFMPKNMTSEKFTSIKTGYYHACGIVAPDNLYCLSDKAVSDTSPYLRDVEGVTDFALSAGITYYLDKSNKLKFSGTNLIDLSKFMAQGSKSPNVDVSKFNLSKLVLGSFLRDKLFSDLLCVISEEKVYCGSLDIGSVNLTAFNPEEVKNVVVSNGVICAWNKDDELSCANILGDVNDKRIKGFAQ